MFLQKRGYKFVAKNYRYYKQGEVDLIVEKNIVLHFVEVKARTSESYGFGVEAVDTYKLNKIFSVVEVFLDRYKKFDNYTWQVDVIDVWIDLNTKKARVEFFEDFG